MLKQKVTWRKFDQRSEFPLYLLDLVFGWLVGFWSDIFRYYQLPTMQTNFKQSPPTVSLVYGEMTPGISNGCSRAAHKVANGKAQKKLLGESVRCSVAKSS